MKVRGTEQGKPWEFAEPLPEGADDSFRPGAPTDVPPDVVVRTPQGVRRVYVYQIDSSEGYYYDVAKGNLDYIYEGCDDPNSVKYETSHEAEICGQAFALASLVLSGISEEG